MSDSASIQLTEPESRLVLLAISTALGQEYRALETCRKERPSRDVQESIKAREQQIDRFEKLREKVAAQL